MRTGIPELDTLLGGDGLIQGSLALLRGSPGSGKTTLGIQILANHLRQTDIRPVAVFVSLERSPKRAIQYAESAFHFRFARRRSTDQDDEHDINDVHGLATVSRQRLERLWLPLIQQPASPAAHVPGPPLPRTLFDALGNHVRQLLGRIVQTRGQAVVLIDSLNVLAALLRRHYIDDVDIRDVLHDISCMASNYLEDAVVLFTGEFGRTDDSIVGESFACDTELRLTQEIVAPSFGVPPRSERTNSLQTADIRRFCRVTKCRNAPNQSRRCTYDIVPENGVVFYPSYPGDGTVVLFAENAPQRQAWEDFFAKDIPLNYPALKYERFDRSGLQRTFASQRGFRYMPLRTDMYLASFDTYWVPWYTELSQKWDIAQLLRSKLRLSNDLTSGRRAQFAKLVCTIHRSCREGIDELRDPTDPITPADARQIVAQQLLPHDWDIGSAAQVAREYIASEKGQGGLLSFIPDSHLRLFGEARSRVIDELSITCAPRPDDFPGASLLRSIPYDANISFLVARRDLLDAIRSDVPPSELAEALRAICHEERHLPDALPESATDTVIESRIDDFYDTGRPATWEEVIALCTVRRPKEACVRSVLIETQTFDTFLCTLLEMLWGCGGKLVVHTDYEVEDPDETSRRFVEAFFLFHLMFRYDVIPKYSSLEPSWMKRRYNTRAGSVDGRAAQDNGPDWMFARHWHSTFVDALTQKDAAGNYIWNPGAITLDLLPIPRSLRAYAQDPDGAHVSCWGEWHLGVLRGSENRALAINLINNLMSSQKICERAFTGAAIPTVQAFYDLYGREPWLRLPDRPEILLPQLTFAQFRRVFFTNARSRSEIFDYRHSMRRLHAILESVHAFPEQHTVGTLTGVVTQALEQIGNLAEMDVLEP